MRVHAVDPGDPQRSQRVPHYSLDARILHPEAEVCPITKQVPQLIRLYQGQISCPDAVVQIAEFGGKKLPACTITQCINRRQPAFVGYRRIIEEESSKCPRKPLRNDYIGPFARIEVTDLLGLQDLA